MIIKRISFFAHNFTYKVDTTDRLVAGTACVGNLNIIAIALFQIKLSIFSIRAFRNGFLFGFLKVLAGHVDIFTPLIGKGKRDIKIITLFKFDIRKRDSNSNGMSSLIKPQSFIQLEVNFFGITRGIVGATDRLIARSTFVIYNSIITTIDLFQLERIVGNHRAFNRNSGLRILAGYS